MNKETLLIVEDEAIIAKDLQLKLNNLGYNIPKVVSSGEKAIETTKEITPDLILMDIKLDGEIDGIEASMKIKENYDIPIIFLTAFGDNKTIEQVKLSESEGYILKPFNLQELHSNIQIILHKHKLNEELKNKQKWLYDTLQSMGEAVITTDNKYNITFFNKIAEKQIGLKQKNVIGKNIDTIVKIMNPKTSKKIPIPKYNMKNKKLKNDNNKINNLLLLSDKGNKTIIDQLTTPIKNIHGKTIGYVFIFQDMTERRNTERILQKINNELDRRVTERTNELEEINKKLENEIHDRKQTQQELSKTKDSMENIINSTSEMIISLDKFDRIEYFNKSAEKITGYKRKEVQGRYLNKLSFIENTEQIIDLINRIKNSSKFQTDKIVIITKDFSKKIINISCSALYQKDRIYGSLIVGKDVTYNWNEHRNLIRGQSYLIKEKTNLKTNDIFNDLILLDYNGLYISRTNPIKMKNITNNDKIQHILISSEMIDGKRNISTLEQLKNLIKEYCSSTENCVILIDGIHYFLTMNSFNELINIFYEINDIILQSKSILLLSFNTMMIPDSQNEIIENEFNCLHEIRVEDIMIKDELFEILKFIYEENKKNSLVSFKKIMIKFDIVYYTIAKRIQRLIEEGLVFTKKSGKSRIINLTEKGKNLLTKNYIM
jgi:PAS domain S-box-containing protein